MPAVPQPLVAAGGKGAGEVFQRLDIQHAGRAHGDVRIAGKITVQLVGVQKAGQQQIGAGVIRQPCVHRAHHGADGVGQDELFEKAPQHAGGAPAEALVPEAVLGLQLGQQVAAPLDGARGDQGEKAGEQGEIDHVPLRPVFAPVDVDEIAREHKGEKADAQGAWQIAVRRDEGPARAGGQAGQRLAEGVVIFKKAQIAQQHRQPHGQQRLARPARAARHQVGPAVAEGHGRQQQEQIPHARAGVEVQAGGQQHRRLPAMGHGEIHRHGAQQQHKKAQ